MKKEDIKPMWIADNGDGTYQNPILYTDYSDPDVIRVEEDYFMVASSFCNAPSVPVLHSKDLVNWKVISYAMEQIPFEYYEKPMHGCGAWAPSIRYHEGFYYVLIPMPDEGIFMCKTNNPWKGWEEPVCVCKVTGWIDPCPFWDDDGNAYMVSAFARSRIGFKSILHISPIKPDCTEVLDDGHHVYDGSQTQPTIEGPKLYKRNGYYYIFAPAGGVKEGWQTVLRSKNIWGPYEEKIVLSQKNTPVNGSHQGGWVTTPTGEDWFIHFQDVGNAGRIIHLQPMKWVEDWPVIGVNPDETGCGEPTLTYKKPTVGREYPICAPDDSDYFDGEHLGLQWQWNANYKKEWYELDKLNKQLILFSQCQKKETQLCDMNNILTQKWPAPRFMFTAKLHLEHLIDGDVAGLVSLGGIYSAVAVLCKNNKKILVQRSGEWMQNNEQEQVLREISASILYLRMIVEDEQTVFFQYCMDGENYRKAGITITPTPGRWVGVKVGIFIVNEQNNMGGKLLLDYAVFEECKFTE